MAEWRNKEFRAIESVAGHGRENVAKDMTKFLNTNGIKPGECFGSVYIDDSTPMQKDATVCGILIYYQ